MKELQQKYNSERESREAAEMEQNRLFIFSIMNAMVGYNARQFFMCIAVKSGAGHPLLSSCDKCIDFVIINKIRITLIIMIIRFIYYGLYMVYIIIIYRPNIYYI